METYTLFHPSPLGMMRLEATESGISELSFLEETVEASVSRMPHLETCALQLDEYFAGNRMAFDLSMEPEGTEFQLKVWEELVKIPLGEKRSYFSIAEALEDPLAVRAVGSANGKNKLAILIPCHRVIGSNGKLTGYAGGLWRKKWLLDHEHAFRYGRQAVLPF